MAKTPDTKTPKRTPATGAPRKTAVARPVAPKPAAAPKVPSAAPAMAPAKPVLRAVGAPLTAPSGDDVPTLRKKELFDRVVKVSGVKKKDAKAVVEATLKVLGDALTAGEELILPPLGKAKINRQKDLGNGEMMVIKLRRRNADGGDNGPDDKDTLADDDD